MSSSSPSATSAQLSKLCKIYSMKSKRTKASKIEALSQIDDSVAFSQPASISIHQYTKESPQLCLLLEEWIKININEEIAKRQVSICIFRTLIKGKLVYLSPCSLWISFPPSSKMDSSSRIQMSMNLRISSRRSLKIFYFIIMGNPNIHMTKIFHICNPQSGTISFKVLEKKYEKLFGSSGILKNTLMT